ncbi:MAG: AI-2E family transporter [Variibacter sp.]|uniref:AI-2E family transporter n=1 Tax=Pseudorhodoplanes sp. TaxID=1934341 RepID=UPI003D13472B
MNDPAREDKDNRDPDVGATRLVAMQPGAALGREIFVAGFALLVVGTGLFLVWQTTSSLLLVFAGVLLATFFDSATRIVGLMLPISRAWRLTLVLIALAAITALGLKWGANGLPEQSRMLLQVMDTQLAVLRKHLLSYGVDALGPETGTDLAQWLFSDQGKLLSHAQALLGRASGILTNIFIILFLGILFAASPLTYRESIVVLVKPSHRARTRAVLDEMGAVLRFWLVGQMVRIALMTICVAAVLYLIGLPAPFLLGLQAGVSNLIPYLGPIAAAAPIGLVAMPLGGSVVIWSLVIYTVIQSVEGYLIGPLIQRQAIEIPPAWILTAIVILGSLFGILGVALAMPLVAVARVAIVRFYVEDHLEGRT